MSEKRKKIFLSGTGSDRIKKRLIEYMHELHVSLEDKSIVDLGCADLSLTKKLLAFSNDITGVDIYHNTDSKIKTITRNLNKSWNLNRKYDFVISVSTIEHLENPYHFFRELRKITNRDSIIIISTHNLNHYYSKIMFLLINQHLGFWWDKDNIRTDKSTHLNDQWHKTPFNKEQLSWIAEHGDFKVEDVFFGNANIKILPFIPCLKTNIDLEICSNDFFLVLSKR